MSEENVALVSSIYSPSRDYADLVDPRVSAEWVAELRPLYAADYEFHAVVEGNRFIQRGQDGYVTFMIDWLTPWETYRIAADGFRDLDPDRVAVLTHHRGRLRDGGAEVDTRGLDLWTLRDGLFLRLEAFMDRQLGLAAAGLQGSE